jgi:hypothetical protein
MRRRLLSIVGALGLVTGLLSSGVAAQADNSLPDSTFNWLLLSNTFLAGSGGNACISNGARVALTTDGFCVIEQSPGRTNVAICIENNAPSGVEVCRIKQTNDTRNNYALVFQRYNQQGGPSQSATQYARVNQQNGTGSNLFGEFQLARQSTSAADTTNHQTQKVQQFAGSDIDPNAQTSTSGSNYALVAQNSNQNGASESSAIQTQDGNELGFLDQTDSGSTVPGAVSKNFVTQSQFQHLDGDGLQTQKLDPRCCSTQGNGPRDRFNINQFTDQTAGPVADQQVISVGNCTTSGNCTVTQSSTQNGTTNTNSCSGTTCTTGFTCTKTTSEGGTVTQVCTPPPPPCTRFCVPLPQCPIVVPCSTIGAARFSDRALAVRFTGSVARLT